MIEMLFGFGIGALALTERGRDIGNKVCSAALNAGKAVLNLAQSEPAEQSAGAIGNDSDNS